MDELGIAQSKISQSAQRIVDRAVAEFRRRGHAVLTNEHIFFAFAELEWSSFSDAMRGLTVTPRELLQSLHEHLQTQPLFSDRKLRVSPVTKRILELTDGAAIAAVIPLLLWIASVYDVLRNIRF